jgi:hypothetical protein
MPDEETLEELRAEAQEYSGSYHGGIIAAYNRAVENAARIEHWLRAPGVRAANNKTRNDRKAKGLCPLCGERKPEEGKVNCRICLDKRAASVGKGHHRLKLDIGPGGELIVDTSVDVLGANEEPARLTLRSHTRIEALNVLWLRAGSFTLKPSQAAALAKVLSDYAQTHKDDGSEETQDDDEDHG